MRNFVQNYKKIVELEFLIGLLALIGIPVFVFIKNKASENKSRERLHESVRESLTSTREAVRALSKQAQTQPRHAATMPKTATTLLKTASFTASVQAKQVQAPLKKVNDMPGDLSTAEPLPKAPEQPQPVRDDVPVVDRDRLRDLIVWGEILQRKF